MPKHVYTTKLSVAEVMEIISSRKWQILSGEGVYAKSTGNKIKIYYHATGRTPGTATFYGTVAEREGGATITGHFEGAESADILKIASRCLAIAVPVLSLISMIYHRSFDIFIIFFIAVIPLVILLFSSILGHAAVQFHEDAKYDISRFIKKELSATRIEVNN